MVYQVKFYKGNYKPRQEDANRDVAVAYVEHHFNSSEDPEAGYAVVVTGKNASATSQDWGKWYAQAVAREFGIKIGGDEGIKVGGFGNRGDNNLRFTNMPAILVEPLFGSNPQHAQWIKSASGQDRLARVLADSIRRFFPKGGLVGFSVGHKYKTSQPHDLGAAIVGGGQEATYAEIVLEKAKTLLQSQTAHAGSPPVS